MKDARLTKRLCKDKPLRVAGRFVTNGNWCMEWAALNVKQQATHYNKKSLDILGYPDVVEMKESSVESIIESAKKDTKLWVVSNFLYIIPSNRKGLPESTVCRILIPVQSLAVDNDTKDSSIAIQENYVSILGLETGDILKGSKLVNVLITPEYPRRMVMGVHLGETFPKGDIY